MRTLLARLLLASLCLARAALAQDFCVESGPGLAAHGVLEAPLGPGSGGIALILPGTRTVDRDGGSDGLYRALADALRAKGLAVARIDAPRRTAATAACGAATSQPSEAWADLVQAYAAVTAWLRGQPGGARLIWLGHSQGALIAAQLLARQPALADGLMVVGMPLRPMGEAASAMAHQMHRVALMELMAGRPCIDNAELLQPAARAALEMVERPAENWLSPSGRWCQRQLDALDAHVEATLGPARTAAARCGEGHDAASASGWGNSCSELREFFSTQSIAALLASYPGPVTVADGARDSHLELEAEQAAFAGMRTQPGPRRWHLLDDSGHAFGPHPFLGPPSSRVLDTLAQLAATLLTEPSHAVPGQPD